MSDIESHMLHFMENHDEHRIASPDFAGSAEKAKPGMVVSATISRSPTMLYFGQEVGEAGAKDAGFGDPGRTTIFDYWGVPAHQRWMNDGAFDGGQSTAAEKSLRDFYKRLLSFTAANKSMTGDYAQIHSANLNSTPNYPANVFSFVRWHNDDRLIVVSNFDADSRASFDLKIPASVISRWQLPDGQYKLKDHLSGLERTLNVVNGIGSLSIALQPLESLMFSS
jgi:glycosidase